MTSTAPAPTPAKEKSSTREYKVLRKIEVWTDDDGETTVTPENDTFELVGVFTASGDKAAMKKAASELKKTNPDVTKPTLVAVADGSWHERAPSVEMKEVVSWV